VYQEYLYLRLKDGKERTLRSIAEKALKEVTYHVRWSSEWVIRLGDGTEESHIRMNSALNDLWKFTGELFIPASYESVDIGDGVAVDLKAIRPEWDNKVRAVLIEATLSHEIFESPVMTRHEVGFGKEGQHTEHLNAILADMQALQRTYPGCEW
jgi:ring-1,2-phenylacetyl-CoA epoxidase subunit PaaC